MRQGKYEDMRAGGAAGQRCRKGCRRVSAGKRETKFSPGGWGTGWGMVGVLVLWGFCSVVS